jgi:hypothetical protein
MIEVEVGEYVKREIDEQIARILRDLGNPPPPLNLIDVRRRPHNIDRWRCEPERHMS